MVTKLDTRVDSRKNIILIDFVLQGQGQTSGPLSALSVQYFMNLLLDITKPGTVAVTREWIIHCLYPTLLNFATGGHLCFSNISCFSKLYIVCVCFSLFCQHFVLYS